MKKILLFTLCALIFTACTKEKALNLLKPENKEYKIAQIINKTTNEVYNAGSNWGFSVDNNRFGLYVGCNRIFGELLDGFSFDKVASTKMLCDAASMKVEDFVLSNLKDLKFGGSFLENNAMKILFK
ncbi:META domain-containing protein [Campylobacter canadensis]|uniref:META domain-containing protein n=1 Tax=Campylobacter canadensis TaxID=449520 RepID=A0ABS7WUJ5_9BACT|nr:META domain-containing protein [Campylobacter canadensis]MBZ7987594.1 META domain-containing protein [Campylobacter canadensis]MBZ7994971.1 META domain-containing protein [Campylobacter canadensis]MBZ7996879.1 META domain-containing protein [Campylobacter canadensis]MBZ7998760.1 META domain-containing protein [Campylobacter canadensis]MBZ8000358.1 META domain-containing protein [Campylobacter canadensis]